jgi:hypothetical protein
MVWQAPIKFPTKLEATIHLTGYSVHILLFCLTILYPFILIISRDFPLVISLFGLASLMNITALAPTIFIIAARYELGESWWQKLPRIIFLSAMGMGMMLNTVRAAVQILSGVEVVFQRTPKYGVASKTQKWTDKFYQLHLDPLVFLEITLALINCATVILAFHYKNWVIATYASLFMSGLIFTSGFTIIQSIRIRIKSWQNSSRTQIQI